MNICGFNVACVYATLGEKRSMNYSVTARLGVVSWGCDYQKSQRGLGLAILFCGWPWSEAHLRHIRRAFVVNKMGRTEGSCAESDIESQQPRQNSQIGPSYFAAVPKQPVALAKRAAERSAGNLHAPFDVVGNGTQLRFGLVRHCQRKRGATNRPNLRSTAPVPDPTSSISLGQS